MWHENSEAKLVIVSIELTIYILAEVKPKMFS